MSPITAHMTLIPQLLRDGESRSGLASIERRVAVARVATPGAAGWQFIRPLCSAAGGGVQADCEALTSVLELVIHQRSIA